MNFDKIINLSDKEIKLMYDSILDYNLISGTWGCYCPDGTYRTAYWSAYYPSGACGVLYSYSPGYSVHGNACGTQSGVYTRCCLL